jgi:hypothetical protein
VALIPIPIYQKELKLHFKGWIALPCPRCQRVQAFTCEEQTQQDSLVLVPVAETKVDEVVTCDFCLSSFGLGRKTDLTRSLYHGWKHSEGLQALVYKTNPQLGAVTETVEPSDAEFMALLLSIREKTSVCRADTTAGMWAGLFAGMVVLGPLGWSFYALGWVNLGADSFGHGFLFTLLGAPAGAVLGACLQGRMQKRKRILELFRKGVKRRKVDPSRLWSLCLTAPKNVEPIVSVVCVELARKGQSGAGSRKSPNT